MMPSSHDAAASALGYLYQTKWPLLELLRRARTQPDCQMTLELLDDVAWVDEASPEELIQAKHHINRRGMLTDMGVDLWKTIGVWMDSGSPLDPDGPSFVLVTTSIAEEDSAAAYLRPHTYDPELAAARLEAAATLSSSQATERPRHAFLRMTHGQQLAFVSRIRVLDGQPAITDLDEQLRAELHWAIPLGQDAIFLGLVWDWWYRQAIFLLKRSVPSVSGATARAVVDEIRDKFSDDNLPTLVPREAFDPSTTDSYSSRVFVRQLDLVDPPPLVLQKSIQDYFRAYTQSALWIENNLVDITEIERFEADLRDEWEREFAWMTGSLPNSVTDDDKKSAGLALLRRCLDATQVQIRAKYREPFFVRGKLHHLADQQRAGWHPDFVTLLESLLLGGRSE